MLFGVLGRRIHGVGARRGIGLPLCIATRGVRGRQTREAPSGYSMCSRKDGRVIVLGYPYCQSWRLQSARVQFPLIRPPRSDDLSCYKFVL